MKYQIFPISENAVTIDFGNEISVHLNEKVIELSEFIEKNPFVGFIEFVPAYSSLTIFYDLIVVKKNYAEFSTAFSFTKSFIEKSLKSLEKISFEKNDPIRIPVDYSEKFAPDLEFVAAHAKLSKTEVIKIHTNQIYRVFMIGFLPAFAYMGEVDEQIATPRRQTLRTKVEKGSVGIAGKQTGIYPLESPGGWQIIGRTETELFRPKNKEISLLKTGDLVQFFDINNNPKSKITSPKPK